MEKILFATSEAVPFIKTGGLADVAGSLPGCFPKTEYDVRVILPKYLCMAGDWAEKMELVAECRVQLNWRDQYAGIYQLEQDGIIFYFVDNEYYFSGPAPYGEIYQDAEKFAYFSKAVLTALPEIGFQPDIIHCHDWQTGLIPVFLEAFYRQDVFYRYMKTVYTIHNLKFQGRWHIDTVRDATGLDDSYFTMEKLESYGMANLLKGGVVFADAVTTVSETYAGEIQTTEGGEGLEGLMRARSGCLSGIVNGLDYDVFNPETDTLIAHRFAGDITAYKRANKSELQNRFGLTAREDAFLIGMVSRMTDQKGFDLVRCVLDEILADDRIQVAVLGTGEQRYEDMFRDFQSRYPGRISAHICYSEEIAHRIYASCDAFLMPSLFEPCGLSQLISLRYGTVPMVRETGGLKDTVEPYDEFEHTGTGFSFHNYNAHEMLFMVRYACKIYYETPEEWLGIIRRGMAMDFSWKQSSEKYSRIYDALYADAEKEREQEKRISEQEKRISKQQQTREKKRSGHSAGKANGNRRKQTRGSAKNADSSGKSTKSSGSAGSSVKNTGSESSSTKSSGSAGSSANKTGSTSRPAKNNTAESSSSKNAGSAGSSANNTDSANSSAKNSGSGTNTAKTAAKKSRARSPKK